MRKIQNSKFKIQNFVLILLSTLCSLLFAFNAVAAPVVTLEELLNNAEKYDAKAIIYKGEVIGDIMVRGKYAWINVRDESAAIGVFCPKELTSKIKYQGDYKSSGDLVSVSGTFYRFCRQHGGDTDIHADRIVVVQQGKEIIHPLEPQKVKASIILPLLAVFLAIVHLITRRFR